MSTKLYLSLVLHNHQPVGNFDYVFEEAYQKAYRPMLEALERHPDVRMGVHNTGCLLDWLLVAHPEYVARLAALAARGQVEILTGGYYEPILVSLPDVDKQGQLDKLSTAVATHFGVRPSGAWLAERVWEPHLARALHQASVGYTVVDDTHLRYAGLSDDEMLGYYVTEEQGATLKLFGSAKYLRYAIPWTAVDEIIAWLRRTAAAELPGGPDRPTPVAVMGDDGEKFGLWPDTYALCWERGWIDDFFSALEANVDWLTTITPGTYAAQQPSLGRLYVPAASYDEMTEWALPPERQALVARAKAVLHDGGHDDLLPVIRGGLWRGFMLRYPEVNQMHKKALWVSAKLYRCPDGPRRTAALERLWAAQCNCGYWHGLFGGLYLFHIRGVNYRNLIAAETEADALLADTRTWVRSGLFDFDRDGQEEVIFDNDQQWFLLDQARGGALLEWDFRAAPYNLLNTVGRRPEVYHADVRAHAPELAASLVYDDYRRGALQDRFLDMAATPAAFRAGETERGDFVGRPYTVDIDQNDDGLAISLTRDGRVAFDGQATPIRVTKTLSLAPGARRLEVDYTVTNRGDAPLAGRFGVETNWGLEGGQDPLTYFQWLSADGARRYPGQVGEATGVRHFALVSEISTVRLRIDQAMSRPADVWYYPIETVSKSEAGYESNYQGTCLLTSWTLQLAPGASWQARIVLALAAL